MYYRGLECKFHYSDGIRVWLMKCSEHDASTYGNPIDDDESEP